MGSPFEPLASCSLLHFSMKVAFQVVITSARKAGELIALVSKSSYTVFHKDKVYLLSHPKFLIKVVSNFHVNQAIYLLMFSPKPHAHRDKEKLHLLDMKRALAFCLKCTESFRASM